MSVQRWDFLGSDACMCHEDDGDYILFADKVEAVDAIRARGQA